MKPSRVVGEFNNQNGQINQSAQLDQPLEIVIKGHAPFVEAVFGNISRVVPIQEYYITHSDHPARDENRQRQPGRMIITRFLITLGEPDATDD
jgi:hypothetical protein